MHHHIRPFVNSGQHAEPCASRFCRITKILTCGSMIATAVLFPLASSYTGGLWFGAVTLAIFILTALIFHSLHIEPFIRFGPYTAPVALILLLLAVLPASPSRKDLIPWLPLFIVSCSLGTVAVDKISRNFRFRREDESLTEEFSGVSIDTWSEDSYRAVSDWRGRRPPSQSNRMNPIYFARHGPSSQHSYPGRSESDITLSGVVGQSRSTWDTPTQEFFVTEAPAGSALGPTRQLDSGMARNMQPEDDLASETQASESDHPLLGSQ